jgi:hypothetical protein
VGLGGIHHVDAGPVDIEELFMNLADNYIAVGVSTQEDCEPCVAIVTSSLVVIRLPEHAARKLADDILRNANYLWPMDEEKNDG